MLQCRFSQHCRCFGYYTFGSGTALQQHVTDVTDGLGRIQAFRADIHAVHDATATEYAERIVQRSQTLGGLGVTAVGKETIGLQQRSGTEELVRIPPERRATGRAARAQNALVQAIQLFALCRRLQALDGRSR